MKEAAFYLAGFLSFPLFFGSALVICAYQVARKDLRW